MFHFYTVKVISKMSLGYNEGMSVRDGIFVRDSKCVIIFHQVMFFGCFAEDTSFIKLLIRGTHEGIIFV